MTKEEAKYLSEVFKAYSDGKIIEYRKKNTICAWEVYKGQSIDENYYVYRIKPEQKLRPYKDAAEFLKAQKEHGPCIQFVENAYIALPLVIRAYSISYYSGDSIIVGIDYDDLIEYHWQDGTPCGILEE